MKQSIIKKYPFLLRRCSNKEAMLLFGVQINKYVKGIGVFYPYHNKNNETIDGDGS